MATSFTWEKFIVYAEHIPLKYLEIQESLTPQQVRWLECKSEFDFDIMPIKSKSNQVADGLSRQHSRTNDPQKHTNELLKEVMQKTTFTGALPTLAPNKRLTKTIMKAYRHGPDFREIIQRPKELLEIPNGMLYRELRLCISQGDVRNKLLHDYHSTTTTGHLGKNKNLYRLLLKYYWKNIRNTVWGYIRSCQKYQQIKARNHKTYKILHPTEPPKSKWDVITMDFVLPLPETKNRNGGIVNVVCKLSKMIRITSIQSNITAREVVMKFEEHIYRNHGLPLRIVSDRDSLFMSKLW